RRRIDIFRLLNSPRMSRAPKLSPTPAKNLQFCSATSFGLGEFPAAQLEGMWGIAPVRGTPNKNIFALARYWSEGHFFIPQIIQLRFAIFNFAACVKAKDPKDKTAVKAAKDWWEKNGDMALSFIRDAWLEWLPCSNAVGVWRKAGKRP